jgi:hypothetical protein
VLINNYFGWSQTGNTRLKYQHYYADDSVDAMLTLVDGLNPPNNPSTGSKKGGKSTLRPKQCPNCDETNKPESKFCVKCKFVLSFDAFHEAVEEKEKAANKAEQQKKDLEEVRTQQKMQTELIRDMMRYIQRKIVEEAKEEARKKGQEWNGDMVTTWEEELYGPYSSTNPPIRGLEEEQERRRRQRLRDIEQT